MPTYTFTHPTNGKTIKITGDTPPDEKTIDSIFAKVGGAGPSISQGPSKWKKIASKIYTPVLEGLGTAGGGAMGTLTGPAAPVGVPLGAGLGYAAGKKLATTADTLLGLGHEQPQPKNLLQATGQTLRDVATGTAMELGGQIGTKMFTGGLNRLYAGKTKGIPFSDKRNAYRAATQFSGAMEPGTQVAAEANQLRQKETKDLVNRLKPTVTPTPGQGSGNYKSAALEQSMTSKDPAFAERLKYNDAELNKAAVNNLTTTLGKPADLPATQPAAMTGASQVKAITAAKQPILSKEAEMWADVPEYPMPANNTEEAFKTTLSTPSTAKKAIDSVYKVFKQTPRTVAGLQTIEREIGSAMKAGTDTDRHFLRQIKKAVQDDFEAMGQAAESGDVALHNDKLVYPSKLKAELVTIEEQIAAAQKQVVSDQAKPDVKTMTDALSEKGIPAMRQVSERDANFTERISKEYQKQFPGQPIPTSGGTAPKADPRLADWTAKKAALEDQLANLQPAEDVAAKYAAAKRYSREEKFERFYRGAVQDVMESGKQASGLRISAGQVPAKFFTPTGSKDLIKAVGREQAAEQSMPHAVEQLVTKTVDANTGVMNIPRAVAWIRQNSTALDNLGLKPSVERIIKGQIPRAIEAELETRTLARADVLGNPEVTALQAAKLIKQFGPSIEKMYGAKGMQALKDYGQMMGIIERNKYVSYAKGSTSLEKGFGDAAASMAEKVSALAAVATGHGWTFSAAKNLVKSFLEAGLAGNEKKVTALIQEGLVNPEAAEVLMRIAKAKPKQVSEQAAKWLKPIINQMQIGADNVVRPTVSDEEPNAE